MGIWDTRKDFEANDDLPAVGVGGVKPEEGVEHLDNAKRIDLDKIIPDPDNRKDFDEGKLQELADSLEENGLLQAIRVKKIGDNYHIIAGERRYRAARKAGWTSIPCFIGEEGVVAQIAENVQREDYKPLEEAAAYRRALDELKITRKELAKRIGVSETRVSTTVGLLELPEKIRDLIDAGKISKSAARDLRTIKDADKQWEKAQRVADGETISSLRISEGKKPTRQPAKKLVRGIERKAEINDITIVAKSRRRAAKVSDIVEALRSMADKLESKSRSKAA